MADADDILAILDDLCARHELPILDNGYYYPAAARLALFRSRRDWALVIEVAGYSPRYGTPTVHIYTVASRLRSRRTKTGYETLARYLQYLVLRPHHEMDSVEPFDGGDARDLDDDERVAVDATHVVLRGVEIAVPPREAYAAHGIDLEEPDRVQVYELLRYLAATERDRLLATPDEQRMRVRDDMEKILQLEEWRHPDVLHGVTPSESETFQQLAQVLATGDVRRYAPTEAPNTHWSNWPDGGSL
jgi:hypothetical protein